MELNVILVVNLVLLAFSACLVNFSLLEEVQEKYERIDFWTFLFIVITLVVLISTAIVITPYLIDSISTNDSVCHCNCNCCNSSS